LRAKGPRGAVRFGLGAREAPEPLERARDVLELARLGAIHRNSELRDALDRGCAARARPGEHEVGLERDQRLEVDGGFAAHARQPPRGGRIVAIGERPHHAIARAGVVHELGQVRREAHDAPRGRLEHDLAAVVVDHADLGVRDEREGEQRGGERRRGHAALYNRPRSRRQGVRAGSTPRG